LDGAELKDLRLRRGLTQLELADRIGVSETTIWNWENGVYKIRRPMELAIRAILEERK